MRSVNGLKKTLPMAVLSWEGMSSQSVTGKHGLFFETEQQGLALGHTTN